MNMQEMALSAQKKVLRTKHLRMRREMPFSERERADVCILQRLMQHPDMQRAKQVFAYVSMPHEVGTRALLEQILRSGKTLGLPVCDAKTHTMQFYQLKEITELTPGAYRIPIPPVAEDRLLHPDEETLVIVPMLSFDAEGYRLGAGGGYYDRFLAADGKAAAAVGICYAQDREKELPHDAYDQKLSCFLTEANAEITEQKLEDCYG